MSRKGKIKVSSKNTNTLKNKVIINIGSNKRSYASKSQLPTKATNRPPPPPPQIIYNTVNPSVDPFAMKQQLASQQLQVQNQLKVNDDLIKSMRSEIAQFKPTSYPVLRPLNPLPSLVSQDMSDIKYDSGQADIKSFPINEASSSSSSSSSTTPQPLQPQEEHQTASTTKDLLHMKNPGPPASPEYITLDAGDRKIKNPLTGRYITIGGQTHKELISSGWLSP